MRIEKAALIAIRARNKGVISHLSEFVSLRPGGGIAVFKWRSTVHYLSGFGMGKIALPHGEVPNGKW
jgi:hypothetical protein